MVLWQLLFIKVKVLVKVLVLISQVVAFDSNYTKYANWTFASNNWGPSQSFGICQPRNPDQLEWHHIHKLKIPQSKIPTIYIFVIKRDLMVLRIFKVFAKDLVFFSKVATLNWHDTKYPNLGYPRQKAALNWRNCIYQNFGYLRQW